MSPHPWLHPKNYLYTEQPEVYLHS